LAYLPVVTTSVLNPGVAGRWSRRAVLFAAPDIIMEPAAEKRNPERAAQLYANNAARLMAGVPSPLYYNGRVYTFQNGGIVFCRVA
jgi:hypothetical protein